MHKGLFPLSYRGSGVKRLLVLASYLLQELDQSSHNIIILDEPENTLHADAQHQLRTLLEKISVNQNIQVIYATHSPAMINPAHPERVRVFSRANRTNATSIVESLDFGENFQRVRISLGICPQDSLLYGELTVLVEGPTEVRCLVNILEMLEKENVEGFAGISNLLARCHFVSGRGDEIGQYCKFVKAHNGRPLVFLDGDKSRLVEKLKKDLPDVKVVALAERSEFENLINLDVYVSAVASILQEYGHETGGVTEGEFKKWLNGNTRCPEKMMVTNKIDVWICELFGCNINKPEVMDVAVKSANSSDIKTELLMPLVKEIRSSLNVA